MYYNYVFKIAILDGLKSVTIATNSISTTKGLTSLVIYAQNTIHTLL